MIDTPASVTYNNISHKIHVNHQDSGEVLACKNKTDFQ